MAVAPFADRQRIRRVPSTDPAVDEVYQWADLLLLPHQPVRTDPTLPANASAPGVCVWGSASSAPVLNNGTLTVACRSFGDVVFLNLDLVIGSTTTLGTGAWNFTLPYAADTAYYQCIAGYAHVNSTNTAISGPINGGGIGSICDGAGNIMGSGTGWGTGDQLVLQGFYRPL